MLGFELFHDEHAGCYIYLCETGTVAAAPK